MEQKVISHTADTLMHHLQAISTMQLDELMLDYADEAVLMTPDGSFHGRAEIQQFFQTALSTFPPEMIKGITMIRQDVESDVAFIVWKSEPFVKMATDTFVVRGGKIVAQTVLMVF